MNRRFSRVVGVSVQRTIILAMVLSGIVGGLGGAAHGLGQLHRFTDGFSAGYGFTGMAVQGIVMIFAVIELGRIGNRRRVKA